MANPRQRRKQRSNHTPVSHSRRAKTLLKKQPPIRGPKVIQDAWEKRKTVQQNYAALGLTASLNPRLSGGVERVTIDKEDGAYNDSRETGPSSRPASTSGVCKGFGRIVRDTDGQVSVIEMDEDGAEERTLSAVEEGLVENIITGVTPATACWINGNGIQRDPQAMAGSDIVRALEARGASSRPAPRFSSKDETVYLRRLYEKHKEDTEAMARDRKLNPDQRTTGELGRAIRKAGGFAKLASLEN